VAEISGPQAGLGSYLPAARRTARRTASRAEQRYLRGRAARLEYISK
jgi:hypothetical protein